MIPICLKTNKQNYAIVMAYEVLTATLEFHKNITFVVFYVAREITSSRRIFGLAVLKESLSACPSDLSLMNAP